jgi:adenosylhomocysteine nucleosidase
VKPPAPTGNPDSKAPTQEFILVCFAMPEEARPFQRATGRRPDIRLLVTGIGARNSARALRAALATARPTAALTCGYAGALDPALPAGEVVFSCDTALELKPRLLAAGAREVRFHCVDHMVATAAEKRSLRHSTGADVVEMESEIIRRLCREQSVPGATVRVISDTAAEDLPLDFNRFLTPSQRFDYLKLVSALCRSPRKIPALLRLRKQTRAAAKELARVLTEVVLR